MPNIVIDIASEFTGKKGFDQAGKSTNALEKSVNKLGKRLISLYAAKKVIQFAGETAKAFAQDEAAAQRLSTAVGNLGLGFEDLKIKQFIDSLESSSAVIDDKLRPAMQALILQTGSFAKAQELLKLAIDVSAGSGIELETVANDLAQAYVGNTKGLKKYYLGLTQAELKASSFLDIQTKLNKQFSGANAYYLNTYAGKMDQLAVGADKAKEIIGKGLIDALEILGGDGGIETVVNGMKKLAEYASNFMKSFAIGLRIFKDIFTLNFADLKEVNQIIDKLQRGPQQYGGVYADIYKSQVVAAEKAAEKAALAKIKADKLAAAAKVKADKQAADNAAKLAKAGAMFDIDKIQIEAALKGKISDDEKLRLELQRAILNEDATLADSLQKKLEASQRATAALQGEINGIKPLADPFAAWLTTLEGIALTLAAISKMPTSSVGGTAKINIPPTGEGSVQITVEPPPEKKKTPSELPKLEDLVQLPPEVPPTNNPFAGLGGNTGGFGFSLPSYLQSTIPQSQPAPVTVIVNNNGTTIMQDEFVAAVNDAVVIANTNGLNNNRPGAVNPNNL